MASQVELKYPSVYAQEKFLPGLKSASSTCFEGLNQELVECFARLTSPCFPDNYKEDLSRVNSAPLNAETKQLLKGYSSLMVLSNLIESQTSTSLDIIQAIESIEDPDFNKDFYYDIYIFRFSLELDNVKNLQSLKSLIPLISRVPKHKLEAICDSLFIKLNSFIDISNSSLTYLAESLKDVSEMGEINGLSALQSNLFESVYAKIDLFEKITKLPEEFRTSIDLPSEEEIKEVLGLLQTAKLKPEQESVFNNFHSLFSPVTKAEEPKAKPVQVVEEDKTPDENLVSTLGTSKKSIEFEYQFDGIAEYIQTLPVKSWDQIKRIERIMKNEEKGLEVIKALIQDENGKDTIVAVKTNICDRRLPSISMQAEYMAFLHDQKYFLKLYGAFWEKVNDKHRFTLIMEYVEESLTQRIRKWDSQGCEKGIREAEALVAVKQLIEGMTILNQKDICHRDIKPDNIFITKEGLYKIADFDVSKRIERNCFGVTEVNMKVSISGTDNFMSPELKAYAKGFYNDGIDYNKSDVYSLGLTVLMMVTKKNAIMWNILTDNLQRDMNAIVEECIDNAELKKIIKSLLTVDPNERPKFRQLLLESQIVEETVKSEFE